MLKTLSPRTRRDLLRILPFGIIWFLFSQIFLLSDYAAVGNFSDVPDTAIQLAPDIYVFAVLAVTMVGLLVGTLEIRLLNNRFAHQSFSRKILYKTLFYSFLLFLVTLITFPVAAAMELDTGLLDVRVWDKLAAFLGSKTYLGTVVQLATMLGVSLFYAEISEHMGPRVLTNFITGKYHEPTVETRIFMFSDMKSSTRIAEQIGHARYYELLRAYYADLSNGIVDHAGEVYQYVGDEVIVSWPLAEGLQHRNCLTCFFAMKRDLGARADWYRRRFGVAPDFKAGFHVGAVTTGEIGALKKEIIFTGDVLNATARIQGLCNTFGVDLLISGDLLEHLDSGASLGASSLGTRTLRGKAREVELFTLPEGVVSA